MLTERHLPQKKLLSADPSCMQIPCPAPCNRAFHKLQSYVPTIVMKCHAAHGKAFMHKKSVSADPSCTMYPYLCMYVSFVYVAHGNGSKFTTKKTVSAGPKHLRRCLHHVIVRFTNCNLPRLSVPPNSRCGRTKVRRTLYVALEQDTNPLFPVDSSTQSSVGNIIVV